MNRPLCVVDMALHPEAARELSVRYEVVQGLDRIGDAEAALVYGIPDSWMEEELPRLKAVGCHSCSDSFSEWAMRKKISVTKADSLWRTVAEHTLALAMTAARNIPRADRDVRAGLWKNHVDLKVLHSGRDFQNSKLGIWGMGQIGRELASLLKGFSLEILYYDVEYLSREEEKELQIKRCSFENLLKESDYFCVLIPLNDKTEGLLNKSCFSLMKKGCVLINTARAGIIVYEDFLEALQNGTIGAAALDVLWEEGSEQPAALIEWDNLIFTPHLGGSTYECDMALVNGLSGNIARR
nr:NAD(P)-dependent oxidoreductase [uncultured Sphaerochaeta sp.]